ncbi:hypothetical protein BVC80_59g63 [Macleaya cordata]|uniref:Disease resistance N-terminal domain-containing protein n=1 Tax=Macleaya cordata TaxID=56857 RepID=A0A200QJQ6_MACCD|nr:hypothetical protein BVC80_59g63 [Macleaya cordata]
MADILVSVLIEPLLNKLISITLKEINGVWGVKDELTKLHRTLVTIKAVLNVADKKQVEDEAVRLWLRDFNDVVYDIEDIFDEFEYEVLRRQLEKKDGS